jgi:hypothetical protein
MSKNMLIAAFVVQGVRVQLKRSKKSGRHFFVVGPSMKWIPMNVLNEEDQKDLEKVRAAWKSGAIPHSLGF